MKCGIMTFNQAINYGAVFQMLALQKTLEKLEVDCEVINYKSDFMTKLYKDRELRDWFNLKTIYHTFFHNTYTRYNIAGFENFISNNIKMSTNTYTNFNELKSCNEVYDCFFAGSDQVFNLYCSNYDENYFLPFTEDNKKNSYAASLGLNEIPDELKARYKKLLYPFNNISIREKTGANVVEQLIGKKCEVNIDPTLLLEKEEWMHLSDNYCPSKPYVLVYVLSEDKRLFKYAELLAKKNSCQVLYINDRLFGAKGLKSIKKINPETWLSLFYNAYAIVTNSFHGVAFSVNFEKTFFPFLLNKNTRVNSRIEDFLKLNRLEYLLNENNEIVDLSKYRINYDESKYILLEQREKSIVYLRRVIGSYYE